MIDGTTLARTETAHPKLRAELLSIYTEICKLYTGTKFCRFSYVLRTFQEQADLFAIGRTKPGKKVTNANKGKSYHNYGLAVDIVMIDGGKAIWETPQNIIDIFTAHGWEWGGSWKTFKDRPHFQKTYGYKIGDLLAKYLKGDFIPGTQYVNL